MSKLGKKPNLNQSADRFYDYLMQRKGEILRYITVALVTGILEFLAKRWIPLSGYGILLPFLGRFFAMFYLLKYWAYQEKGTGPFYTGRQLMLGIMILCLATLVLNHLTIFLVGLTGKALLMSYGVRALQEIAYFVFYQFIIFKETGS